MISPGTSTSSDFVANMEDVPDVYKGPYDPDYPVICMDESPKQLISEGRLGKAMEPGYEARVDYEYVRYGVVNVFMTNEPLTGKRYTQVTEYKTMKNWTLFIKKVATENHSSSKKITLVMDNYRTHVSTALYETFDPVEAKSLWDRFEFIYTQKYGGNRIACVKPAVSE